MFSFDIKSFQAILSQFMLKQWKWASQDDDEVEHPLKPILGGDPNNSDDEEPDDEELEAQVEVNKDCEASDNAEIQDLAQEVVVFLSEQQMSHWGIQLYSFVLNTNWFRAKSQIL